ncbi:hypothetical protein J8J40_22910, partial [Mycobacterium tuberculosis]|nr:hypothetical protein [Mycobacterium tuberculosis]
MQVALATNNGGWLNAFDVATGDGNDSIAFTPGTQSGAISVTDGSLTTAAIDAGAGADTIDFSAVSLESATIDAGAGNDNVTLGAGAETLVYVAVADGNGLDIITGFDAAADQIDLQD